jgi:uncharacterized protein YlaI
MNLADEDFECENVIDGQFCGKQAPDVQLRNNPLCKGMQSYLCDDCFEQKQELAKVIKERKEKQNG